MKSGTNNSNTSEIVPVIITKKDSGKVVAVISFPFSGHSSPPIQTQNIGDYTQKHYEFLNRFLRQ